MRNAVITGASKGIGKAIAQKLVMENFNLIICARDQINLDKTVAELQKINAQVEITGVVTDMGKKRDIEKLAAMITKKFYHIEILVNNAGAYQPGNIHTEADGVLEEMLAVNLFSAYHLTRSLLPGMIKRKSGHIFNIVSVAGLQAYPAGGSYSISKFALMGFSKNLREELAPHNIKVTAISPGATQTASWDGVKVEPGRMMQPEDIADVLWSAYNLSPQTVVEDIVMRPIAGDMD